MINHPPSFITTFGDQTVTAGTEFTFTLPECIDTDSSVLTYDLKTTATWVKFDKLTLNLTGEVPISESDGVKLVYVCSDGEFNDTMRFGLGVVPMAV